MNIFISWKLNRFLCQYVYHYLIMTYYLKPPRGRIALHILHKCVKQRFEYLRSLQNGKTVIPRNFEYLIDGNAMDRAGHFILRLLSLTSPSFKMFVLEAETTLFVNRLSALSYNNITNMLKVLYRHVKEILQLSPNISSEFIEFLVTVKHVCKIMLIMEISAHAFKETHLESCSCYNIHVPFRMCLPLVEKREVELKSGKCIVPCGKWKCLLAIIFYLHLEFGMKYLQTSGCAHEAFSDPRIHQIAQDLGSRFNNNTAQVAGSKITAQDVHERSIYFPPCMLHLYRTLRSRHRLTHEARRQLTLFLKDVGMPVEEALDFWRLEYSLPSSECASGCTHSWQKDARRYHYSIRHMYGLEGGRYTYMVSSCRSMQVIQYIFLKFLLPFPDSWMVGGVPLYILYDFWYERQTRKWITAFCTCSEFESPDNLNKLHEWVADFVHAISSFSSFESPDNVYEFVELVTDFVHKTSTSF